MTLIAILYPPQANQIGAMFGAPVTRDLYYRDLAEANPEDANLRASYPDMITVVTCLQVADDQIKEDGFRRRADWQETPEGAWVAGLEAILPEPSPGDSNE